jgi:hypothetical protein
MASASACFCIAGWHYPEEVYARLRESGQDLYAVCHRLPPEALSLLRRYLPESRIFREPNLGYDWGCYQQFLRRGIWEEYGAVFFMHDDLSIHSLDFVAHTLELLRSGAQAVGNGRNHPKTDWPKTHTQCYAHSCWLPASLNFQHTTVRGSFFAASAQALEAVKNFEIFWDPRRISIRFGNHSLIATGGKLQHLFGEECFAFLSQGYRSSPYLIEHERGGQQRPAPTIKQRLAVSIYNKAGRAYVAGRMQPGRLTEGSRRRLEAILGYFDGVDRGKIDAD